MENGEKIADEGEEKVKLDIGEREINNEFPEGWCPRGKYENSFHSRSGLWWVTKASFQSS